jgi:hypothetical protein
MQDEQSSGGITRRVKTRVQSEVSGNQVVSATRERAQAAAQAARGQLPATREDVTKLQDSLDRIEAALVHLQARVDAMATARPKRTAASTGNTKTQS